MSTLASRVPADEAHGRPEPALAAPYRSEGFAEDLLPWQEAEPREAAPLERGKATSPTD
jgi:hypothetical protein